jgi:hypothetical protein
MRQTFRFMKSRLSQLDEAHHALRNATAKIDALSAENAALKVKLQQFTGQRPNPAPLQVPSLCGAPSQHLAPPPITHSR